jgi:hypothetical protein
MKGHSYYIDSTAATAAESITLMGLNGVNTPMINHTRRAMRIHYGGTDLINANVTSAPTVLGNNLGAMSTIRTMCRLIPIAPLEASSNNGLIQDLLFLMKQKCNICSTAWHGHGTSKAHWQITNGVNWLSISHLRKMMMSITKRVGKTLASSMPGTE